MAIMRAAVLYEAGGPDVFKLEDRAIPTPKQGEVLIHVKALALLFMTGAFFGWRA
jgi:NADPH:quinone reductase-like Zn-dependent oxidoreductase